MRACRRVWAVSGHYAPPPVVASPVAYCYCLFVFSELNVILSKPTNPPVTSLPFHWLQIIERIKYNLLSLTCKVLTTTQPSYLHKLIIVQPRTLPVFLPSLRLCVRPSVCLSHAFNSNTVHFRAMVTGLQNTNRKPHADSGTS